MGRQEFESTAAHTHKHRTNERKKRQHTIENEFLIFSASLIGDAGSRMEDRSINTSRSEGSLRQQQQQTGSSERENKVLGRKEGSSRSRTSDVVVVVVLSWPAEK